jgi:1,2-diacylglycerol 3-beta-glucosyltransferase
LHALRSAATVEGMSALRAVLDLSLAGVGCVAALFGLYLLLLAVAALFAPRRRAGDVTAPVSRIAIVVPAHDEATTIARCIRSLQAQTYPKDLYEIVVVADNCTDDTAEIASAAGAVVLERHRPDERGKGQALRFAFDRLLVREDGADAIVVVDADSFAEPELLEHLVRAFEAGAGVVQAENLFSFHDEPGGNLRAVAVLLINRVRPVGRAVLGLPCGLTGSGMLFGACALRTHPWNATSSVEDAEYALSLRLEGVRPAFAAGAVIRSEQAPNARAAEQQQLRWEGGKVFLARTWIPRLVRAAAQRRDPWLLDAAFDLAVPPLGFLAAGAVAGTAVTGALAVPGAAAAWVLAPWLVAVAAVPLFVLVGLRAAGAPSSAYRALAGAPAFVLRKVAWARRLRRFDPANWTRTERAGDGRPDRS